MWHIYIVKCKDKTLYTGITNDIKKRINEHNRGKGAKYTRGRGPVKLIYKESFRSKGKALSREYAIKSLKKGEKLKLIRGKK